ncbi:MAG: heavy metal translocating P-type ATPase [Bacilli bacterium]
MKTTLQIPNINCPTCAMTITEYFKKYNIEAIVNVNQKKVIFIYEDRELYNFILKELKTIGFPAAVLDEDEIKHRKKEKLRLIMATIFVLPLAYTLFNHFGLDIVPDVMLNGYFQMLFAAFLQFVIGFRFYKNSFYQIKNKNLGMDVLIVLGTSVAFFYSVYLTIFTDNTHLFFETSGMLIWMVTIGEYLEHKSKSRTTDTLKSLMALSVDEVRLVSGDVNKVVALEEVKVGDYIKVLAGEKIPLDGEIVEGASYIDDSVISGEFVAKYLGVGSKVIGSTTNLSNTLIIKVSAVGSDTVLSKIINTVEETSLIKPKFQRTVDVIAKYFVFAILIIATMAFILYKFILKKDLSLSLEVMIAVLVVSCPCALGLATPTSIAVSSGLAFKNKILYKGGEFFELANKIEAIAFDKTGTLTKGELVVSEYFGDHQYLIYTKSLEIHSNHPIGKAINSYREEISTYKIDDYEIIDGKGIKGIYSNDVILVGSLNLLEENKIANIFEHEYKKFTNEGKIVIFTAINKKVVNMMVLEDELKEESLELINELKRLNIKPYLITGDNENTARYLAKKVGIEKYFSEVLPNEKADIIRKLQTEHKVVAFVGDGINDAPALKQADVSFSVSNATDIASDTADVVMLDNDLRLVLIAIDLSKKTTVNIIENLVWASIYNLVMIPLSILNITSPLIAGFLHVISSILVVLNALRLNLYKYKSKTTKKVL